MIKQTTIVVKKPAVITQKIKKAPQNSSEIKLSTDMMQETPTPVKNPLLKKRKQCRFNLRRKIESIFVVKL